MTLDSLDDGNGNIVIVHEIVLVRYVDMIMFSSLLWLEGSDSYG